MRKTETFAQFRSKKSGIAILLSMYLIMGLGYPSALSDWFVFLTPIMFFITSGTIWLDSKPGNKLGWPIAILIIVLGYCIEIAGVHMPILFGSWTFGEMLGWKFFGVPPVIGLQWLIMVWGAFSIATAFEIHPVLKWLFTALLGTGLFWIMEPLAQHFKLWTWNQTPIPFRNYGFRFLLLFFMAAIFEKYPLVKKPRMGQTAMLCQFLFFIWLRIKIS